MPYCTRQGLDKKPSTLENLNDNDKVFYLETTQEIFKDYEEYFRRVMLINSTIWTCSLTGRSHLTYAEALKSEKNARKNCKSVGEVFIAPALIIIKKSQQKSLKTLISLLTNFFKDRYFLNEEIFTARINRTHPVKCKILEIIPPNNQPTDGVYIPSTLKYKVQSVSRLEDNWVVDPGAIRRRRSILKQDMLKFFIKDMTLQENGVYIPKPDKFKTYVVDKNFDFEKIFIGQLPDFEKFKKSVIHKQTTISKYLVKNNGNLESSKSIEKAKNLQKEMERIKHEKELQQKEIERKKAERMEELELESIKLSTKCDDLERYDQKPLPIYKPIKSLIPTKYFGDFLRIQEFFHSFSPILAAYDIYKTGNISFAQMYRAFTVKEVAGPLSEILQVLLSTIFSLQFEEEDECQVEYVKFPSTTDLGLSIDLASQMQIYIQKFYFKRLHQLPLDSQTLSELLRLHLYSSGAKTDERSERWRFQYRNGFSNKEDPGILFRIENPHILKILKVHTVYELEFADAMKLIDCLINQILTMYGTVSLIEERRENQAKDRLDLRLLIAAENKRVLNFANEKKTLTNDYKIKIDENKDDEVKVKQLENKMEKDIELINLRDEKLKRCFQEKKTELEAKSFDYILYLGSDRAYRNYYIFESIKGIFIEHPTKCYDFCLKDPPKNCIDLAHNITRRMKKREIKRLLFKRLKLDDKENISLKNNTKINKNSIETIEKINGTTNSHEEEKILEPNQYDLYMCTGDSMNCIVHNENDKNRVQWSYISNEEDFLDLIESLNSLGNRESALREKLTYYKNLIINHIKECPENKLTIEEENRKEIETKILNATQRKYIYSNFGFDKNISIDNVMYNALYERILQFENDICNGNLGKLKVDDFSKWCNDLLNNTINYKEEKLSYGIEKEQEKIDHMETIKKLNNEIDNDFIYNDETNNIKVKAQTFAFILLKIVQCIDQKFLKEPFGINKDIKDEKEQENRLALGKLKLKYWEMTLMNSTNYSQVFLHLNIISDAVNWRKSTAHSLCIVCKRKNEPEKMLLCDDCNAGTHMFCMKPKLKKVPEGNWYCFKCAEKKEKAVLKQKKKRKRIFMLEEESESELVADKIIDELSDEEWDVKTYNKRQNNKSKTKARQKKQKLCYRPSEDDYEYDDDEDRLENQEKKQQISKQTSEQVQKKHLEDSKEKSIKISYTNSNNNKLVDTVKYMTNGNCKYRSDESSNENTSEEDTDEKESTNSNTQTCSRCFYNGGEISCNICNQWYHLDCIMLIRMPRGNWLCSNCKLNEKKRKQTETDFSSDDSDAPLIKRSQRLSNKSESKQKNNSNGIIEKKGTIKRSRRTGEYLLDSVVLYNLLEEIMKHDDAWPFLRPVTLAEVPDYNEIIKQPMDFAKIKSKLNMCYYTSNEEVMHDIHLVFQNCDTYNQQGNDIYNAGASLEKFVSKRCKKLNLPLALSDMNADHNTTE